MFLFYSDCKTKEVEMNGFARIVVSNDDLNIRFESVGYRGAFDLIMARFNQSFPLKEWDSAKRVWRMPLSDLQQVIAFCESTFGSKGYHIQQQTNTV